jgi:hypothetical protein
VACNKKSKNVRLECFWAPWKVRNEAIATVSPEKQTGEWKVLDPHVKGSNLPKWALRAVRKAYGNLEGI